MTNSYPEPLPERLNMLLVKTHKDTLPKVIEFCKHALDAQPTLSQGEIILIAQTKDTLSLGDKPIRYRMEFYRIYADNESESERIWQQKHWAYILEGRNCRSLKKPFDISEVRISNRDYKQGGPFMHVAPEDIDFLYKEGYLETL